jgi:putative ABC transport system permease protein
MSANPSSNPSSGSSSSSSSNSSHQNSDEIRVSDVISLSAGALRAYPLRSALSMLGISIGVMAVVLLTSIGEGTRLYILDQFMQFGTTTIAINPGKVETGGIPGIMGGTTHKLTIDDAEALARVPEVLEVVPIVMGQGRVEGNGRSRSVYVYGTTAGMPDVLKFGVGRGQFLPPGDPRRGGSIAVLGPKLKHELFGDENALGEFVRVAGTRFRVIGIMAPKGRVLGFDIDDAAYIPVASAMQVFNVDELMEIDLTYAHERLTDSVAEAVKRILSERHGGREDFTITTQTAMIETFGKVMNVVTMSVGAIAGVSLLVGAIGILTMMWISVGERISEIGLMRALGATKREIQRLFLLEAALLTTAGGLIGIGGGLGVSALLRNLIPGLPIHTPIVYMVAALSMSVATGLISGIAPARRAASLEPVDALRTE